MRPTRTTLPVLLAAIASGAQAQSLSISWHTIDCGGAELSGPTLSIASTAGQHDAGSPTGDTLSLAGGFWADFSGCPGDFNLDGIVDTRDVLAFLNAWTAGDPRSDFNRDGVIDTRDVLTFLNEWAEPCA